MKIKFNHFERVAGLFVLAAIVGSLAAAIGVGIKKGWFTPRVLVHANLTSAEGIYPGTVVQVSGLRAGEVSDVQLLGPEQVRVTIAVKESYFKRLKADTQVQIVRPFVIGEKVMDLTAGSAGADALIPGAELQVAPSVDIMELLSGRTLGTHLATMGKLAENMRVLAEAFSDQKRIQGFVHILDELHPLVMNLSELSKNAVVLTRNINKKGDLEKVLSNTRLLTEELNKILPELNKESPTLGKDMAMMATNLSALTAEFGKLVPMISQMAPHLPKASGRAIEALDETVVTLKALQKSFLLRSAAREVREEETKREEKVPVRAPASEE